MGTGIPFSSLWSAFLHPLHRAPAAQLVSVACLYLAGKVEDSPKSVRDVLAASCQRRSPELLKRLLSDRVGAGEGVSLPLGCGWAPCCC